MSEWKEFTGSPEQIEEIQNSKHGYCVRMADEEGAASCLVFYGDSQLGRLKTDTAIFQYLIAEPHPLEDMICQQARTGQEVWVLEPIIYSEDISISVRIIEKSLNRENVGTAVLENGIFCQYSTRTPYWHIPDTQYSFTRIGGYRANK